MTDADVRAIRRIALALDSSSPSLAALAESAELAAHLQAELAGLFVEDVNLFNLASLPFVRELGAFSAIRRPLGGEALARMLRAQAARAEQALVQSAKARGVTWTFRVRRGEVPAELLAAAGQADLLALGIVRRARELGEVLRAVLEASDRPVLLLPEGSALRPPVTLLIDETSPIERMIALALQIPIGSEELIRARVSAGSEAALGELERRLSVIAPPGRVTIEQRTLVAEGGVVSFEHIGHGGVLFLAASGETGRMRLRELVCRSECALMLVR